MSDSGSFPFLLPGVAVVEVRVMTETHVHMPHRTAIANTLVTAWATGKLFNQHPAGNSSNGPAAATPKM